MSIKVFHVHQRYQVYQRVSWFIKCIKIKKLSKSIMVHQVYQDSKVIKKYQNYIKCINEYLGSLVVYQVYQMCISRARTFVTFYILYKWIELVIFANNK